MDRALLHMEKIEFHPANFAWFLCSFGPPSRASGFFHLETGGMPLHDAVGVNSKKGETTENQGACRCLVYGLMSVCWMMVRA